MLVSDSEFLASFGPLTMTEERKLLEGKHVAEKLFAEKVKAQAPSEKEFSVLFSKILENID